MSKYDELKKLAEAAPKGEWSFDVAIPERGFCAQVWDAEGNDLATLHATPEASAAAQFIAAANPAAILELIAENERLTKEAGKFAVIERVMEMLECDEREGGVWTACTLLLTGSAHKLNSDRSVVDQEGVTVAGEHLGDWRVTVERIKEVAHV